MPTSVEAEILDRLAAIEARLSDIDARTACTSAACDRMNRHINFVERVYGAIRRGFAMIPGMPSIPPPEAGSSSTSSSTSSRVAAIHDSHSPRA